MPQHHPPHLSHLTALYLNVFCYALFYHMQAPLLPFLTKDLGGDRSHYGSMQSIFSLVQLLGGVASGPLGDTFGSKSILFVSNIASASCYLLTASATSMMLLNLSRLPTLFQHGMLGTRGMISTLTPSNQRSMYLGYIGLAYGIGSATGPALGGLIALHVSLRSSAWISAIGSVLCAFMVYLVLPSTQQETQSKGVKKEIAFFNRISRVLKVQRVKAILCSTFMTTLSTTILQLTLPFVLTEEKRFNATSENLGYLLSYGGMVTSLFQGLLLGFITNRFRDAEISLLCTGMLSLSFIAMSFSSSLSHIWMVMAPLLLLGSLFSTVNTSQLSKYVLKSDIGTVLALDMGVGSFIGIFGSQVGLYIWGRFGFDYLGLFCALCCSVSAIIEISQFPKPQTSDKRI